MNYKQIALALLASLIFLSSGASAETMVTANGFPELQPVDSFGNVTVIGHHSAVLNLVSVEDANKSWNVSGELRKCSFLPIPLSTQCLTSGNTDSNLFLTCATGSTVACGSLSSGVRTTTSAVIVNTSVSDTDLSSNSSRGILL